MKTEIRSQTIDLNRAGAATRAARGGVTMVTAPKTHHLTLEPSEIDAHEVGLAWAGCKVDGHLHVDQYRALRAVLARHAQDPVLRATADPDDAVARVAALREALEPEDRVRLFLTTAWVTLADGRTHGRELWLLCELRRALGLEASEARALFNLARGARLSAKCSPTLRELETLLDRGLRTRAH